ncbi:Nif3-like dinuclear metal center hexameric protein [Blautia sp. HCP3S3_H10_1]|uniref:Nif3-like dinuclear metal center hexameric protein n=1 Tax=unclassified Blautia TaxID=2648079 RepID=UPI003F90752B|nr:Nif3-like dinuclear metal center hexameric protein [Clostridia bacterium]
MRVNELTSWLEAQFPAKVAEDWDNVGLLTGDDENQVNHVFLALDLTEEVLEEAIEAGADMIVTHHPMIFSGIKKINNHSFTGRKIISLVRHGISYYAMHTNYDILGMADLSARYLELTDTKVLSVTGEKEGEPIGFGRVGNLPCEMTLKEYALLVKKNLKLSDVKVYGELGQMVKTAAVCTGSGKSMIQDVLAAGADVYVTGDIDHHTGIDTVAQGLAIIDAGHYGTEYIFMEDMKKRLEKAFPELTFSCAKVRSPYTLL